MAGIQGLPGALMRRPEGMGLLAQVARSLKGWLRRGPPGLVAPPQAGDGPSAGVAGGFQLQTPTPEHVHQARFTVEELDACIEDTIRHGQVDLAAARSPAAPWKDDEEQSPRQKAGRRRKQPPQQPDGQAKAFGGDLYPTAAHGVGRHMRYVRSSTWSPPPQ